jgi:hypothetical protein
MVRQLEMAGVKMLMASLLKGVQTMELIAIMWLDYPHVLTALKNLDDIQFDITQQAPPRPIQMIDGNHRTHGMQGCNAAFPKKPLYQKLGVILLILPRTRPNIQICLYIGNSHNKSTQVFVKTTQWQIVQQYRRQFESIEADTSLSPEEKVKAFSAYKQRTAAQVPFESNTLHTFSAVSSVQKKVFDKMSRIFAGEFKVNKELKGQKTPDAMTHFVNMSGIPVKHLCDWLDRVIDGQWLTSTFMKRCKIYTKQVRVTGQILEDLQGAAKVYPKVIDAEWFDMVVSSCEDAVKSKLTAHAIKLIEDMVDMTEKLMNEPKVFDVFFVVLVLSFFLRSINSRFLICPIPSP